jgi:hypothetical protein
LRILWAFGRRMIPRSVMMAEMSRAGVTSNAGLYTCTPAGAVRRPKPSVISSAARCSIGIFYPSAMERSKVDDGAAT